MNKQSFIRILILFTITSVSNYANSQYKVYNLTFQEALKTVENKRGKNDADALNARAILGLYLSDCSSGVHVTKRVTGPAYNFGDKLALAKFEESLIEYALHLLDANDVNRNRDGLINEITRQAQFVDRDAFVREMRNKNSLCKHHLSLVAKIFPKTIGSATGEIQEIGFNPSFSTEAEKISYYLGFLSESTSVPGSATMDNLQFYVNFIKGKQNYDETAFQKGKSDNKAKSKLDQKYNNIIYWRMFAKLYVWN